MRIRLLFATLAIAAVAAPSAEAKVRGVETAFLNCTGPCGVVQFLRAPDGRSIDVVSSLHSLKPDTAYRVGASTKPCSRPETDFFIVIEALPVAGADDDFRVPTVQTRRALRRVRTIRLVEVAADGTATQVACARSFPARGVEAVFTNCTGPCGVVQLLRAPRSTTVEVLSSTHALPAIGAGGAGTYAVRRQPPVLCAAGRQPVHQHPVPQRHRRRPPRAARADQGGAAAHAEHPHLRDRGRRHARAARVRGELRALVSPPAQ